MKIIQFLLGNLRLTLIGLAIVASLMTVSYFKGRSDQKSVATTAELHAVKKGVQARGKTDKEVISLDDAALDRELSKWMRD